MCTKAHVSIAQCVNALWVFRIFTRVDRYIRHVAESCREIEHWELISRQRLNSRCQFCAEIGLFFWAVSDLCSLSTNRYDTDTSLEINVNMWRVTYIICMCTLNSMPITLRINMYIRAYNVWVFTGDKMVSIFFLWIFLKYMIEIELFWGRCNELLWCENIQCWNIACNWNGTVGMVSHCLQPPFPPLLDLSHNARYVSFTVWFCVGKFYFYVCRVKYRLDFCCRF